MTTRNMKLRTGRSWPYYPNVACGTRRARQGTRRRVGRPCPGMLGDEWTDVGPPHRHRRPWTLNPKHEATFLAERGMQLGISG